MEDCIRHKRELGRLGEDIACDWLSAHGHTVLRRNYRSGHLEIDIVSIDKDGIHFVEVKTRRFSVQAPPQESSCKVSTVKGRTSLWRDGMHVRCFCHNLQQGQYDYRMDSAGIYTYI